jgi:hypothetical protein
VRQMVEAAPAVQHAVPLVAVPCRWSAVSRGDRYRKRLQENGDDTSALGESLPAHLDGPVPVCCYGRTAAHACLCVL